MLLSSSMLSETDLSFDSLEVFPAVWVERKHFFGYAETKRDTSAFFFILSDIDALFLTAGKPEVRAKKGDIVYIPADICYRGYFDGGRPESDVDTYTLNFNLRTRDGEPVLLSDHITVLAADALLYTDTVRQIGEEIHSLSVRSGEMYPLSLKISSLFTTLLCGIAESDARAEDSYPLRRGLEALRHDWNKNEKIETYAALCGMSVGYFYRLFRKWSGKSPIEYRNLLRLSNACTMLRATDMPVGEIASLVGFEDYFYFCRLFKKKMGLSPQKYRKKE